MNAGSRRLGHRAREVGQDLAGLGVDAERARGAVETSSLEVLREPMHRGEYAANRATDRPADADDALGHVAAEEGNFGGIGAALTYVRGGHDGLRGVRRMQRGGT